AEYFCGLEEHTHGETCYDEDGTLICELSEHIHTEECLHPAVRTVTVEIYTDGSYATPAEDGTEIILTGRIPADAAARAFPVDVSALEQLLCAYDIEIVRADGTVYEPEEQITVSIQSPDLGEKVPEGLMDVYYIPENGDPQRIDSEAADGGVVFAADHFSVYAVTLDVDDEGTVFTYVDSGAGLSVTLTLQSTYYTTTDYNLMVVEQSAENYSNALSEFTKHGEVINKSAIYKIYLKKQDNSQDITNLNTAYSLEMSWANGLFEPMDDATETRRYTYCQNSGSQVTDLPSCTVSTDENGATVLTASASSYPGNGEFLFVQTYAPNGLTAGSYTLEYNSVKDAFLNDPAYSKYYNANSPIGTAGSFHIVAFKTATLSAHTNGNVLAKNLVANNNFGTNGLADELSYVQNYLTVHPTSASSVNHVLALGSENDIGFEDNGNAFSVNGVKLNAPYNLVQDTDTATAPFIDLARVEREIKGLSAKFNGFNNANLEESIVDNDNRLILTKPSGVGVAHYTAANLATKFGYEVQIDGFQSGKSGTVVINVDCAGVSSITMPRAYIVIDGQKQSTNEVTEFSNGKVIWNFVNAEGVTITTNEMTGIVLAPGATVNIGQNLNGTVVAKNVNVKSESHRTDFTGNVVPPSEETEADEYYITVQKTETGFVANTLPGAEFNLFKWNGSAWEKVNSNELVTDGNGVVMLRHLEASVAYKLEEIQAPAGYLLKNEAYYFWVKTDENQTQPATCPEGFSGSAVEVGGILLAANDKIEGLSLTVKKVWKTSSGQVSTDVPVASVTIEVLQNGELYQKLTLNAQNRWQATLADLPETDTEGTEYTYTVNEIAVDGYTTGIESETDPETGCITVTITNIRDKEQYKLPETGKTGNSSLYVAGALLLVVGAFLLYVRKRREEAARH
ncbi:MAG: Cna B-type domain-containing protein, partial [Candidatus Faecivicinus sp.]